MSLYTIVFVIISIYLLRLILTRKYNYWSKKKVPHLNPLLLFGNYKDLILLKTPKQLVAQEICQKFPDEPYIGTYFGTEPALLVQDPDILKLILTQDFYYFNGREVSDHVKKETVTRNLFFYGGDDWKILRQNLTPLFTTSKMKNMFPLIIDCANNLKTTIEIEREKSQKLDAKSFLSKYTVDCITNCAFGFNANTMTSCDPNNIFVNMGKSIVDNTTSRGLKNIFHAMWPQLFYGIKLNLFDTALSTFFHNLLIDIFNTRLNTKSSRNDFVDLILSWKKREFLIGDSLSNIKTGKKNTVHMKVTDELLVSQCVLMFGGGFETTSNTLMFFLYEIAKHQEVQTKLIEEIDAYFEKHNGIIEYECTTEMPYLESCIDETMRLYPVFGILMREVMSDYVFPTGLSLKKGDRIHIPVYHLHHNPKNFPNPKEFRPERFFKDEKNNIKPYTYLPFGEGFRRCIGTYHSYLIIKNILL